jgi:hypothetical protein
MTATCSTTLPLVIRMFLLGLLVPMIVAGSFNPGSEPTMRLAHPLFHALRDDLLEIGRFR